MDCKTETWALSRVYRELNSIDFDPEYQREAGAWSVEKEQLLIDSLMSGFDIPKIYFHVLDEGSLKKYAVVDGKQRLTAIVNFMNDEFPISSGPNADSLYSSLSGDDQDIFREIQLDIVEISNSDVIDIEDLFFRLNNGEALNNAEKRNAFGGDMARFLRDVAQTDFFTEYVRFKNERYSYLEAAAPIVASEAHIRRRTSPIADYKKTQLDSLVIDNKSMSENELQELDQSIDKSFSMMKRVFVRNDPMLGKTSWLLHYYLAVGVINRGYSGTELPARIRKSFESFELERAENLRRPENARDPLLLDFGLAISQGSRSKIGLETRVGMLTRNFLLRNTDVAPKTDVRDFTPDQRYVLWRLAEGRCQANECSKVLDAPDHGEADHVIAYANGGPTTVENGQFLCMSCNREKSNR